MMKKILRYSFIALLSVFLGWYAWNQAWAQISNTPVDPSRKPRFAGTLLIASDADQIGTAYANGVVNKTKGIEDSLTILHWDSVQVMHKSQLHISNSVISWPSIIAHSPDRHLAYIVETRGLYRGEKQKLKDVWTEMPQGKMLSVVDIANPRQPKILQQIPIGINPKTVSINKRGDILLVASQEQGKEIVLARLNEGLVAEIFALPVSGLSRAGNNGGVNMAEFHPTDDVIAIVKDNKSVAFYEVLRTAGKLQIAPIGETIEVGKVISVGNFTPDGRYFLVSDVQWGDSDLGAVFNGRGYLSSIHYDAKGSHRLVSKITVGLSPEGFDISPSGEYAVVVNMRRTYLPQGLPYALFAARKLSSLSLVKIDPKTGVLELLGKEYGFEGELPEDAVFDATSKTIAVTVYQQRFETFPKQGYIEFWELEGDKLHRTPLRVPLTRGCHAMELVR